MNEPPEQHPEPPPAAEAPAIVITPPPPPEPYQPGSSSGSDKRQRQHVEQFRTDDAEHAELRQRAWDMRMSVSSFCRQRTLGDPGPRHRYHPHPPADVKAVLQSVSALNRVGNNLNQMARAQNELLLIAREMGNDRLASIITATMEQTRALLPELSAVFADIRREFEKW